MLLAPLPGLPHLLKWCTILQAKKFMLLTTNVTSKLKKDGTKCKCKKAMAVYIPGAIAFLKERGVISNELTTRAALKNLAESSEYACSRVKVNLPQRQVWGCHYSHDILPDDLLANLKDGKYHYYFVKSLK